MPDTPFLFLRVVSWLDVAIMSSVKVAVRVRPFNEREKTMGAKLCIEMSGKSTTIHNIEDEKQNKTFAFDYSYWSHDGFENDPDGYSRPTSSKYADQEKVFNDIGKDVLNNAFDGYNACLFAYGQTGAGKSYSMVGYGANKGIVVRACEEIFERIKTIKDPLLRSEVTVSMLEIYNEAVQDLLVKPDQRPKGGLKIRHTPQLGTFVQDLTKHPVDTYDAIQAKLDEGEPLSKRAVIAVRRTCEDRSGVCRTASAAPASAFRGVRALWHCAGGLTSLQDCAQIFMSVAVIRRGPPQHIL